MGVNFDALLFLLFESKLVEKVFLVIFLFFLFNSIPKQTNFINTLPKGFFFWNLKHLKVISSVIGTLIYFLLPIDSILSLRFLGVFLFIYIVHLFLFIHVVVIYMIS